MYLLSVPLISTALLGCADMNVTSPMPPRITPMMRYVHLNLRSPSNPITAATAYPEWHQLQPKTGRLLAVTSGRAASVESRSAARAAGGTGRRARLRGVWGKPSGFESRVAHHWRRPHAKLR